MGEQTRTELAATGLKIRREVLGDSYVDKAVNNATAFNQPMQDLVNEYCWGAIWGREGLTRKERSLINLGILTALGRMPEVEAHVRGALRNGLTEQQISEVFLQTAIYCGVPAAIDSFRAAAKVLAEKTT
ncbi:MAG: 4-carboxymuconolactone decarboxylase [Gammaproteobacteria bacterium RIFCSPLOWO2_02_FULL_56_15]|nr:MAG: 4-carboxymuconolactone decarboxylase [Gammaproteobacteria bacterium RIFCSPLOWO2_02_FULL_56_15]